jgi:hypothetical protein
MMSTPSFHVGVNYPWQRYGHDFGETPEGHYGVSLPEHRAALAREFARIRDCGAKVVRWFLFGDGRGGFISERGIPQRPDPLLFTDLQALLELAREFELRLCFSLIDYLWLQEPAGHQRPRSNEQVMHFAAGREAFLHQVLVPMFREFRKHPALFAWEIANEPEWAICEFHRARAAKMHFPDFRAFAEEIAAAVHEFAGVPVTLGSARLEWVRAWREIGLDFYQAHYYPTEGKELVADLAKQFAIARSFDQPLWLGEFPARDEKHPEYSVERVLSECWNAGLLGAAIWRWTTPEAEGTDGRFGSVEPEALSAWNSSSHSRSAVV